MSAEERALVIAMLPSEFPVSEASPPEGDDHLDAFSGARDALRRWYAGPGRCIYVAGSLPVYYPGERMFSPDLMVVDDTEQRQRDSWIVDAEGKGIDVAIDIVVRPDRRKHLDRNVERYAALGIREYYLFDRKRMTLAAWELDGKRYRRRIPQNGCYESPILELDLWLDGDRLRFSLGEAPIPYADELLERVSRLSAEAQNRVQQLEAELIEEQRRREEEQRRREEEQRRREEEQRRREEEQRRREEEQRRREAAETALEELRAELERLRARKD